MKSPEKCLRGPKRSVVGIPDCLKRRLGKLERALHPIRLPLLVTLISLIDVRTEGRIQRRCDQIQTNCSRSKDKYSEVVSVNLTTFGWWPPRRDTTPGPQVSPTWTYRSPSTWCYVDSIHAQVAMLGKEIHALSTRAMQSERDERGACISHLSFWASQWTEELTHTACLRAFSPCFEQRRDLEAMTANGHCRWLDDFALRSLSSLYKTLRAQL